MSADDDDQIPVPETPSPPAPPGYVYAYYGYSSTGQYIEYGPLIARSSLTDKLPEETDEERVVDAEIEASSRSFFDPASPIPLDKRRVQRNVNVILLFAELAREMPLDTPADAIISLGRESLYKSTFPDEQPETLIAFAREIFVRVQAGRREEEAERTANKKKRRKLGGDVAKKLAPIARRLKKSKHQFQHTDGKLIDLLVDGKAWPAPDAALVLAMERVFSAIGFHAPSLTWPNVKDFAGASLGVYFHDEAIETRAHVAFDRGVQKRAKRTTKKVQQVNANKIAAAQARLERLR